MATHFRVHAFGGLWLADSAGRVSGLESRRGLACLALLAVLGPVPRSRLAALLWTSRTPEAGRRSLKQLLYTLRQELGDGVVADRETVRLDPSIVTSDVADLLRAAQGGDPAMVVATWAGDFLEGFHLDRAPEFDRWAEDERLRFRRAADDAWRQLAEDAEHRRDHAAAIAAWRRRLDLDPLDPSRVIRLMEALAAAGDLPAALAAAAGIQARLYRELELGPDPEVAASAGRLRAAGRAHPLPVPRISLTPAPVPPPPPRAPPAPWKRARLLAGGIALSVLVAAFHLGSRPDPALPRVAVLPLANAGRDTLLSAFGELTAAWISRGLLGSGRFVVVDPEAVGAGAPSGGATRLVSGRFSVTAESIRVVLRLSETAGGHELDTLLVGGPRTADPAALGALVGRQAVAMLERAAWPARGESRGHR